MGAGLLQLCKTKISLLIANLKKQLVIRYERIYNDFILLQKDRVLKT